MENRPLVVESDYLTIVLIYLGNPFWDGDQLPIIPWTLNSDLAGNPVRSKTKEVRITTIA